MKRTIKEIKVLLNQQPVSDTLLKELGDDERKGVQSLVKQYARRVEKEMEEKKRYENLFAFENDCRSKGYQYIAGIDEVGRGPLAGPVVAAAVILPADVLLAGLNDSKQLSHSKREELFVEIKAKAIAIGIGVVSPEEIDRVNIYEATKMAMGQAIQELTCSPDFLLLDAMSLEAFSTPQLSIIKGDAKSISIAAASVIAKVTRDHMMVEYEGEFPGYGFAKNAGYGTKEHLMGLEKLGVTPIHRKTFAPIKHMI